MRPVRSCIIGDPTHVSPRRAACRNSRSPTSRPRSAGSVDAITVPAAFATQILLRHVRVALRFQKKLLDAAVGVAGHRIVADEAELRPHRQILMLVEQQPFELLVALHRERLEIQADALFERPARNLVRKDADHCDGQQRQRNRHERQLPADVEFQRHILPVDVPI